MMRDCARALVLVLVLAFLFIVAEVQQLDEFNETPIWSPQ